MRLFVSALAATTIVLTKPAGAQECPFRLAEMPGEMTSAELSVAELTGQTVRLNSQLEQLTEELDISIELAGCSPSFEQSLAQYERALAIVAIAPVDIFEVSQTLMQCGTRFSKRLDAAISDALATDNVRRLSQLNGLAARVRDLDTRAIRISVQARFLMQKMERMQTESGQLKSWCNPEALLDD